MCLSICHTHTCPHISYINHLCRPNAHPPTCPYRKEETRQLNRRCERCLNKEGLYIKKSSLEKAKARRLSEAAEIRKSTIADQKLTLKRLEQAEEYVKAEKRENIKRRKTTGGISERGKDGKIQGACGCVTM